MVRKSLLKKTKRSVLALTLLTVTPVVLLPALRAEAQVADAEHELFESLRKFLFSTRSEGKKWIGWCDEWIKLLDKLPAYSSLKTDLNKVRRWKNPTSIAIRLDKALGAYYNRLPDDIQKRAIELGEQGMIELIGASLAGRNPNVPESQIVFDEQAE